MIVRAHLKRHNKPSPLDKQHSGERSLISEPKMARKLRFDQAAIELR
jgi:hypothetical protein